MTDATIITRLKDAFPSLSPKLKKLASYIIDNHKDVAFLNATALSAAAGVSEATVTRLAYSLKLKGYPELRQALQNYAKNALSLPRYEPKDTKGYMLGEVAAMEQSIINEMLAYIPPALFNKAVQALFKAKSVTVVGTHYNAMPAFYASYFLNAVRPAVHLIKEVGIETFNEVQAAGRQDVVLALSTARYPKDTQEILTLFKKKGSTIIAITDSQVAPVIPLADLVLIVPMKFISFIDPYAGVMILIHALVTSVYMKDAQKSKQWVKKFNEFMDHHDYHCIKDIKMNSLLF